MARREKKNLGLVRITSVDFGLVRKTSDTQGRPAAFFGNGLEPNTQPASYSMTRNGKIARLPKDLRELVNRMMDDNAQHRSIINELEKHRHRWPDKMTDINEDNVGNWKAGGYLDWVREQEIQADLQARHEYALVVADQFPEQKINDVALQIGVNHFYHILASLDRDLLQAKLRDDPATWCKVVNTLGRISRAAFDLQKYKDHIRQQKERVQAELDKAKVPGGLTPETLETIEHQLKLM